MGIHGHGHGHGQGHSHGHGHGHGVTGSVDAALESSAEGLRALLISFAGLALTAGVQIVVFAMSGSAALLADTVHNLADALTALPLGVAFWIGRRRPTKRYTYGYGRAEDLAGIFIVAMIALSLGVAVWEAVHRLMDPQPVRNVAWVVMAGVVGFAGNEVVAAYRIRVGRRIGSAALVADGLHARSDGLASLAVVAGAAGAWAGWPTADPVVGLAIAATILVVLTNAAREIYRRLMDSVDPDLVDQVHDALAAAPGIEAVEEVRIRWVGHSLWAEAEVVSDCDLTVADAHAIAEEARHRLLHDIPRLSEATIHTSPCSHDGRDHHAGTAHHFGGRRRR